MRVVCATDLLPRSEAAVERASLVADQLGADLTLLHVVAPGESERALEQTLQAAVSQMKSRSQPPMWRGQRVPNVVIRAGSPARIIRETTAHSKAQLLVLGPHRKRPIRDTFEGTIAEKALTARTCPLLVVQDEPRSSYRRILLALDLSETSAGAIRAAESLVLSPDADATIVHAFEPPYQGMLHYADVGLASAARYAISWKREARTAVRDLLKYESADFTRYDILIEQLPTAVGILHTIERYKPDLLVMGTSGGGRLRRALVGSVANRVLHEANCDALIVPEGSFGVPQSKRVLGERRALHPSPRAHAREAERVKP
jgi:nucleotide-binding universal stress UspA family protein